MKGEKTMKKGRSLLVPILSLIFIVGMAGTALSEETLITGSGAIKKAAFFYDTPNLMSSDSTAWTDAFSVKLPLKGTQCIAIMYSGEIAALASVQFQALVDGEVVQGDAPYLINKNNTNFYETAAMNWWQCGLGKGDHTLQIQFKPAENKASNVRKRTLIVLYGN
jgi:hypothetical protein